MMKKILLLLALVFCVGANLFAQVNLATIEGTVLDESNNPIPGTTVMVRNESTGFETGAITNGEGAYVLRQLPLGGPYKVTAAFFGYNNSVHQGYTLNQGDVIKANFIMKESAINVDEVVVVGNKLQDKIDVIGASTSVSAHEITTLPVNGRNFTALSDLSPLASGSSLSGQIGTAVNYSLDGMSASGTTSGGTAGWGPYVVSMEAISEFEVITNSYDVTLGRGGGGTISAVTKSGTNTFHGSGFFYKRSDDLSSKYNANGNIRDDEYSKSQYGFSLGGPIVKDKAHFFVAFESQTSVSPRIIADIQTQDDAYQYSISKENLDKYLDIAYDKYGVSREFDQVGSFEDRTPSLTGTARIDWNINDKNHLTIRNNLNRHNITSGVGDNSKINLYETYANHLSFDNSFLATLRSQISDKITNEFKAQYRFLLDDGTVGNQLPSSNIPRAIVEGITSDIDGDGEKETYLSSIQLGGQRYSPEQFKDNTVQLVNNIYYDTDFARWTLGADFSYTHLSSLATNEMNGRYYYNGLEAFENNTPYRFAREIPLGDPRVQQGVINSALYAQADMALGEGLNLVAGLRGDYTHYLQNPTENETLVKELGLSTTNKVRSLQIQPRLQFTWDVNNKHTDIIKIGGGIVGSNMNNYAMINNLQFDGNNVVSIDYLGSDIPSPDFVSFRKDPSTVPGAEMFDKLGVTPSSTYNINSADLKMPTTYKYSFSYSKFITPTLRMGLSFYGTNTRNNYMYVDANMVDDPCFTLKNEGDRGVYVPAETITSNGNTDWTKGRKSDNVGRVLELISEGTINSYSFVIDGSWRYFQDGTISASYTWNDTKDNTSYNGNVANSATLYRQITDDPRDMATITYSDNQFRKKFLVYGNTPSVWGINLGFRYSGMGGKRYSAVVNGNINGDFVPNYQGNDLAFVFDPNDKATPKHIADGINTILENPKAEESFKDYLRSSFGKVAERNGGENGFYGILDVKLNKDFSLFNTHKIGLSVECFNFMNLLNKDWGLSHTLGKQTLYNVKGFDQTTQQYEYSVNTKAGVAWNGGNPWQIQLGLKYSF